MACERLERWQIPLSQVLVHSDQDSVYRSYDYVRQLLVVDGVTLSYSDNPWVESMWGRLKVELGSAITCAQSLAELVEVVTVQLRYYNRERRHSSLDYRARLVVLAEQLEEAARIEF